jgi:hypothetical protein
MKLDRALITAATATAIVCLPVAAAAAPVRAADALPSSNAVTTNHLPARTLKTMGHKEHLQGGDASTSAGTDSGLIYGGIALAGIAATLGVGLSSSSNDHPDSP